MKDKKIIICDIDGTIANLEHRLHYIKNPDGSKKKKPDWDAFHGTCLDDEPYRDVIEVLTNLYDAGRRRSWLNARGQRRGQEGSEREIYFFSGRNESVRRETLDWLWRYVVSPSMCHEVDVTPEEAEQCRKAGQGFTLREKDTTQLQPNLLMRSEGDRRPDTTVKYEMMYEYKFMPEDVLCILDDRQAVVDMWRENGFRVMQVDAWKEPATVHHLTQEKLESLNKAELIFLIEHERKHLEELRERRSANTDYNSPCLEGNKWQDELRNHIAALDKRFAKEHDTSKWTPTGYDFDKALSERTLSETTERKWQDALAQGKGTSPNATPIPMLDTPNFDLGDAKITITHCAEEVFFEELDRLLLGQDGGEINRLGAPLWLVENYGVEESEAKRIVIAWAKKKGDENTY